MKQLRDPVDYVCRTVSLFSRSTRVSLALKSRLSRRRGDHNGGGAGVGSPVGQFPPNIPLSSLQRPISGRCMAAVGLLGRKEAKILAYRGMITLQQLDESEILPSRSWLLRGEPKRNMKEKKKQASKQ